MKAIYGLYAEGDCLPRYVGQTQNPEKRFLNHVAKIEFVESLYRIALPEIGLRYEVLEETDCTNGLDRERYWIEYYKKRGAKLANKSKARLSGSKRRKFTDEEADAIRAIYATGKHSQRLMGYAYGCGTDLIGRIVSGKAYKK